MPYGVGQLVGESEHIHDQAARFFTLDAVHSCDRLHQVERLRCVA